MVKITISRQQEPIEVKNMQEAFEIMQSEEFFRAIGEFMFRFSQLEYLIKSTLASYLKLRDDQFDVVVGPYDFAMLCTVAEKTIKLDFDTERAWLRKLSVPNAQLRAVRLTRSQNLNDCDTVGGRLLPTGTVFVRLLGKTRSDRRKVKAPPPIPY